MHRSPGRSRQARLSVWLGMVALMAVFWLAQGATSTWDSEGKNNNWSTAANWVGDVAPVSGTNLTVSFGSGSRTTPRIDVDYTLNSIIFTVGAPSFTINDNGGELTFDGTSPLLLQQSANAQEIDSPITLNQTLTIDVETGAGILTLDDPISGTGGLIKEGGGQVNLRDANTFSGSVIINEGTLLARSDTALGSGGSVVTVNDGGTLTLESGLDITGENLTISGDGAGGGGALRSTSGNNNWIGSLTTGGDSRITVVAATLTIDGVITSSDTLIKDGAGALVLDGTSANDITGLVQVDAGRLDLAKNANVEAISGDLEINGTATVRLMADNQMNAAATLTLNNSGILDLNGNDQTIAGFNTSSATSSILTGGGTLTVDSDDDSTYAGRIQESGGVLVKLGSSTLTLTGTNGYTGATQVREGVINIQNNTGFGSTGGGVIVSNGAAVEVQGSITVGTETLTLYGTGVGGNGALRNISGTNSWAGAVTLATDARIQSDAGTLTISGNFSSSGNHTVTIGGSGDVTLSGRIQTGSGGVTKEGSGTLTISGTGGNTYTGDTTLNAGTVIMSKSAGVDAIGGGTVIINNGSTLQWGNNNQLDDTVNVNLAGGTLNLNSLSDTANTLTLSADSTINFGSGSSSILEFASGTYSGGTLTIDNWSGTMAGTGERLQFGSPLSQDFLDNIQFAGHELGARQFFVGGMYVVVPIPEPSTVISLTLLGAALGWRERRRLREWG